MEVATKALTEEHEGIRRVLSLIRKAQEKFEEGQAIPDNFLPEVLDFIKTFADTCHHGKEEGVLFPLLEERGMPKEEGPIGMMLMEHDLGRSFVKEAADALQKGETKKALDNLSQYADLLWEHIDKENNILYPMGNEVLSPKDQDYLKKEFNKVESEKIGPGRHEAYHSMIEKWEKDL